MSINDYDAGFWLRMHARGKRHRKYMRAAEQLMRNAYALKEKGWVVQGYDQLSLCINSLAACGCPTFLWPEYVREKVPTEMGGLK
jgi:hypothetical protein